MNTLDEPDTDDSDAPLIRRVEASFPDIEDLQRLPPVEAVRGFLALDASSGILLLAAAGLGLICANTALAPWYEGVLQAPVVVQVGAFAIDKPALLWINDGLMAVFFLLVGLEVKREFLEGRLSDPSRIVLPGMAAIGGVIVPSGVYVALNWGDATALEGWAIPAATDIAFALGVLALLGSRVPPSLKVFLLVLAILDDLVAILVIAVFYSSNLSVVSLAFAGAALLLLWMLNLLGVLRPAAYVVVGVCLWTAVLKSGVHATLAGVALAFAIPARPATPDGESVMHRMEDGLQPWVSYGIVPVFAFANAGVALGGLSLEDVTASVPLGIFAGLFLGKQAGVLGFATVAILLGFASRPAGASWLQLWGVSALTGIGFTMSLFISSLAFQQTAGHAGGGTDLFADRLGILAGSAASALLGSVILLAAARLDAIGRSSRATGDEQT